MRNCHGINRFHERNGALPSDAGFDKFNSGATLFGPLAHTGFARSPKTKNSVKKYAYGILSYNMMSSVVQHALVEEFRGYDEEIIVN